MQISRSKSSQPLGKYFKASEFFPKDGSGKEFYLDENLVNFLNAIRDRFDAPITITSGIRSTMQQMGLIAIGYTTATNSYHTKGKAADITAANFDKLVKTLQESEDLFDKYGVNGVNVYHNRRFVHVDTRIGQRTSWGGKLFFDEIESEAEEETTTEVQTQFVTRLVIIFLIIYSIVSYGSKRKNSRNY